MVNDILNDWRGDVVEEILHKELTEEKFTFLFDKAWEKGHANGLIEVLWELEELLDVIIVFNK